MEKNYIIVLVACVAIVAMLTDSPIIIAQESNNTNSVSNATWTSADIDFSAEQGQRDHVGTDVTYVQTFKILFSDLERVDTNTYKIVYHVDDVPITQFDNIQLPYEFSQNFVGMDEGSYTVRIDIKDDQGNVLATKTTVIVVDK